MMVNYDPKHLQEIQILDCHKSEGITQVNTEAVTFLDGTKPIAIIGWFLISPGVLQLWAILSEDICNYRFSFPKCCLVLIKEGFERYGFRRMQLNVKEGYEIGIRWAKFLGFNCEGLMTNFDPSGLGCYLFARIN